MSNQENPMSVSTEKLVEYLTNEYGVEVNRSQLSDASDFLGVSLSTTINRLSDYKSGRGVWNLSIQEAREQFEKTVTPVESNLIPEKDSNYIPAAIPVPEREEMNLVPDKDDTFVPFGNFSDLKKIIKSKIFYPTFITGMSGNGKTVSVEQSCAQLNRELIRVNITVETDEDDLIGGFRLVDGNTVWHDGPVIEALERGAVLLLDEVDLASNKILCLQSVLEGKGIFLKKIGKFVRPTLGFNIIATANTKGKGSDDGRFIGANVLNEAFLERFAITFEQEYPTPALETKILQSLANSMSLDCQEFVSNLVRWADIIRKTFAEGGVDEVISTRRLTHIMRAYSIFENEMKSVTVCLNRFDEETKQSFLDLYDKIKTPETVENNDEEQQLVVD